MAIRLDHTIVPSHWTVSYARVDSPLLTSAS